jgi:hypothetical protein
MKSINMSFNFEPIPYKEIKSGKGEYTTDFQKMLLANARKTDECLGDINYRMRGTNACFTDKIVWDDDVLQTITAGGKIFRGGGARENINRGYYICFNLSTRLRFWKRASTLYMWNVCAAFND